MIEKCSFGKMVIAGRTYDSDLWILPDQRIQDSWWRKNGHRLDREDLTALIESRPSVLVVGTGIFGRMRLAPDIESHLKGHNIDLHAARTKPAAEIYNRLLGEGRVVAACFHLTC